MSVLSRDILKWIQSLDLTYSVRNVKRDFANGFLVAEILTRFKEYTSEINMHSYDNGTATARRKDNWQQLLKVFRKRKIPIDEDLANGVVHCKSGAAVAMVEKLYTHLTKKTIAPAETKVEPVPAYARPTASKVVKDKLKDPEVVDIKDRLTSTSQMQEVIDSHEMNLRQDRMEDRERYTHTSKHQLSASKMYRVPTRQVKQDDFKQPEIQFLKSVNVKPISDSIAQLRASQRFGFTGSSAGGASEQDGPAAAAGDSKDAEAAGASPAPAAVKQERQTIDDLLGEVVRDVVPSLEGSPAPLQEFTAALLVGRKAELDRIPDVFARFREEAIGQCAEIALDQPKQFWKLSTVIINSLGASSGAASADAVIEFTLNFADECRQSQPGDVCELFQDYMMPKLVRSYKASPSSIVRGQLADIMAAFCASDADRVTLAKALNPDLAEAERLDLLSLLAVRSPPPSKSLSDIYLRNVNIGLKSESKELRSRALALLGAASKASPSLAQEMLGDLKTLSEDPAWSIQSGVVYVLAAAATALGEDNEEAQKYMQLIEAILKKGSEEVLSASLCWMADCLSDDNPGSAQKLFLSQMRAAPSGVREKLCSAGPDSLPPRKALDIARAVVADVVENKMKNLDDTQVGLLTASVVGAKGFREQDAEDWGDVLRQIVKYVLVEFHDAKRSTWAASLLTQFFKDRSTRSLANEILLQSEEQKVPILFGFLNMMYPNSPPECQETVRAFLQGLVDKYPEDLFRNIFNLLKNFEANQPQKFGASNLKGLMRVLAERAEEA